MARTFPNTLPTTKFSPTLSVPFCDENGCHRAATAIQFGFQHCATCQTFRRRLQVLQIGNQADHFHQQVQVGVLLRRNIDEDRLAAPVFRNQSTIRQLLLHAIRQSIRLVDLVDGNNDRNLRRLRVIDSFQRLRHHAVIRRDHEHNDIRHLRSARTHAGERFVTRRIEEHDLAAKCRRIRIRDAHFVRADVLRNSASFAFSHVRLNGSRRASWSYRDQRDP